MKNHPTINEYIRLALDTIGAVIIIDSSGRIVFLNDRYAKVMGISKPYPIGEKLEELYPDVTLPLTLQTGKEYIGDIYEHNGDTIIVNRMLLKDGSDIVGAVSFSSFGTEYNNERLAKHVQYLRQEIDFYKSQVSSLQKTRYNFSEIVTRNPAFLQLKETAEKISQTRSTVLISGESGTGKEMFAQSIHNRSPRANHPFICINCAAIPEHLLESERFGYEEGSFTGAKKGGKVGKIQRADKGTLLMDEINSLPLHLQAKLLRVLQEREVTPIGAAEPRKVDVRYIFTTNRNLSDLVASGKFREDLYYRIQVVELTIPPLRERKEDILPLVDRFIVRLNEELGLNITGITPEAQDLLMQYDWPGNVRELENSIERAFNLAITGQLDVQHFQLIPLKIGFDVGNSLHTFSLKSAIESAEKMAIIRALKKSGGNKKKAAEYLGIDRSVLYDKLNKYHMKNPAFPDKA